jgi:biopolymer transport protein ExbD
MNVIPFVDIMLVLLTIVLMTSSFIASGMIPMQLPAATGSQSEIMKNQMIEIDRDGRIFTNGAPTTLTQMHSVLNAVNRRMPILIRADRGIHLQCFVDVLDAIKTMNFERVSLQTTTGES